MKKQVEEKINFYCGVVGEFKSNEEWMEEASKSYKLINKEKKNKKSENTSDMDDINNDVNNLLKLGVTSIPKLKPKKKRKNKKKNKKSTVKSEKVTMVKKNTGTFEKVTNFIKSLSNTTSS
jgi:hypothetical protein